MTSWTVICQALLSVEFSRQEDWSGFPFPFSGDLPNLGIEPGSPALKEDYQFIGYKSDMAFSPTLSNLLFLPPNLPFNKCYKFLVTFG